MSTSRSFCLLTILEEGLALSICAITICRPRLGIAVAALQVFVCDRLKRILSSVFFLRRLETYLLLPDSVKLQDGL